VEVDFVDELPTGVDLGSRLQQLPYRFVDPVPMDKRADPRDSSYGSRIDGDGGGERRESLHRVKQVLAPDRVQLEDGKAVRLLGVRSIAQRRRQAEEHLRELTGGKKVYLRFDDACPPRDDDALVYLYLRNRTPINRHLIRSGLVEVDTTRDYRFKKAFLAERGQI